MNDGKYELSFAVFLFGFTCLGVFQSTTGKDGSALGVSVTRSNMLMHCQMVSQACSYTTGTYIVYFLGFNQHKCHYCVNLCVQHFCLGYIQHLVVNSITYVLITSTTDNCYDLFPSNDCREIFAEYEEKNMA